MAARELYTEEEIQEILSKLEKYITDTDIPIVAEFAYMNDIRRAYLYENELLAYTIKKLIDKKEAQLEREGLDKTKFTPMHAFSLKQLGWSDKKEDDKPTDWDGETIVNAITQLDTKTD